MKCVGFIPMNNKLTKEQLAKPYIKNIIRFLGVPRSIILNRDMRYVKEALGTNLLKSTLFHPATIGQTEMCYGRCVASCSFGIIRFLEKASRIGGMFIQQ